MFVVKLGRLGNPGERSTVVLQTREAATREDAEVTARGLLRGRGVPETSIDQMLSIATDFWTDDLATKTSIQIYPR